MEDGRLLFKVQRRRVSEREDALPERDSLIMRARGRRIGA